MLRAILNHLRSQWYKYVMEVIVVILGILIAYNLEQWNDARKDKKREIEILKELKSAIDADIKEMKLNIEDHEASILSSKTILKVISENIPYHDSLDVYFSYTHAFTTFSGRVGPIEQLKNNNLEIISNDKLRLETISMYDEAYPRLKKVESIILRDYENLRDFDRLYFEAYNPDGVSSSKNLATPFWGTMHPIHFNELIKNPEYTALLRAKISNEMGLLSGHYKPIVQRLSNLHDQIGQELKKIE